MRTLVAYHQCFNNRKATEFAVRKFREHNPDIKYYLVSDGGSDFSDIAEKYNLNWVYDERNVGMNYLPAKDSWVLVERIMNCFDDSGCQYMLLMEDDILCRGKIEVENDFDLAGANTPGNFIGKESLEYIQNKYKITPNVNWYNACGGTILNKNIFYENYEIIETFIKEDHDYIMNTLSGEKYGWSFGSMDSFLGFLYMICGKQISINSDLIECLRYPNWESSPCKLVHQYKEHYV